MWDLDNWIDVINELRKEYSIILTYKPADARYARIILNHTKDITHFPNLILNELIVLVKYAQLVVTPDTSLVHIASAFDKPLVALYSSNESNFKKFAPLSSLNIALRASDNSDKINSISVSSVLNAVNNLFINIPHI
jgi:ADP-heptose:LPS heptosyltransferase